jgi:phosphoribosylformimino-5-aminoimidazole carboxamide ribonucleotide (ProFAR) isomerase
MISELNRNDKLLLNEIRSYIKEAKTSVAVTANSATTILYWNIGNRINKEILENKRAEYGKQIIVRISSELTREYGKGWSEKHLRHCLRIE